MKFFREPLNWIALAVLVMALCVVAQTLAAFYQVSHPGPFDTVILHGE